MTRSITETTVTIRGVAYQLRGDANPEHIGRLAAFVDEKMRTLEETAKAQTPAKLAILASLTIADELFQERDALLAMRDRIRARTARLETLLDEALHEG
jgi:cell division protein ZapA